MDQQIVLDNGQVVLPDWAKEVTMKKMAADMAKLSKTIEDENVKLIRAITGGGGTNSDANKASDATKENTKNKKKETEEIKKTTKEYNNMRGMSVSLGAAVGGAIGGLVSGIGVLTGAIMALTTDAIFRYTASLNQLTDVGLSQSNDGFVQTSFQLRSLGMSLDEATDFALETAGAMQALGVGAVADLLGEFDRMTASGSALGLTLQDNTAMFREELNFATRMGTINRLDEKGRGRLLKQTGELRETQLKYTGALGVSLDVIRQFAFQMLESSSDFQSRLLLMNEDVRQDMLKGAQEFVSVLRATGGELGGELAAAAIEAASFGAIGFSDSAKAFITVLPTLAGSFNKTIQGFNSGLMDGEEMALEFTEVLGNLTEGEKQRIFAIARTGDQQALTMAKGIMNFQRSLDKLKNFGLKDGEIEDFQRTTNLIQSASTQIFETIKAVSDRFLMYFIKGIDYDKFNNAFTSLKNSITTLAETFFGIDGEASNVAESLANKLPVAIDYMTLKVTQFNKRVQDFLDANKGASIADVFKENVLPLIKDLMHYLSTEFMVFFNDMLHRVKNAVNPLGYYDEDKFEAFLQEEKETTRARAEANRKFQKEAEAASLAYAGSSSQRIMSQKHAAGNYNFDTDAAGLIRGGFAGDAGGYRFITDSGYSGDLSSVATRTLGSSTLDATEQAMFDKYKALGFKDDQDAYLKELNDLAYKNKANTGINHMPGEEFKSSFDTDGIAGLSSNEFKAYLETLIMLTRRQTKTIEEGNM